MNAPLPLSYRNAHHNAYRRHEPALLVAREQTSTTSGDAPDLQPAGAIDTTQRVRSPLIHMGFREREARALIDRVLEQGAPDDTTAFLHAALRAT